MKLELMVDKILVYNLKASTEQARDTSPHLLGYAAGAYNTSRAAAL